MPGFAQLLAGSYIKGILFIFLEFIINVNSRFNEAIMLSFLGKTAEAGETVDYGWLMFYPCLYFFAMWDAYKTSWSNPPKHSYLPFAFAAYFVTLGLMVSPAAVFWHKPVGPVFFPMMFAIPGLLIGGVIRKIVQKKSR
ncbi:hypothetical protein BpJC7_25180 [Weizmannia acidilactici]|uniref:Uncharacterized protein n=1 Tax=Weizmannia acidilactici TaxID=2607726 RepID=A0A5J4JKJ3_9BACI|nr:hypothetical protein BpJC4_26210 [Weizmannia acidilactici]GER71215.1 hypothetical protein BpJC7_25180 [Weizmannia acidilactici]